MAKIRTGKLHAEIYFEDTEIGMWFKIPRVNYVAGNENDLNNQIDDLNIQLKSQQTEPKNQKWLACLSMLHDKYFNDFQQYWKDAFCSKSYLMIFNITGKPPTTIEYSPFDDMFADGFVVYKQLQSKPYTIWEVATKYDSNNLAHRFRRADFKSEVKPYLDKFGTVTPPPVTHPADDPDDPGTPEEHSGGLVLHINCPHCGKVIF